MNIINMVPYSFTQTLPDQESVHLADLGIGEAHQMGYAPVSKELSTCTRAEEVALHLAQPEDVLVIHRG